jgi:hypothetical protein
MQRVLVMTGMARARHVNKGILFRDTRDGAQAL